MKLPIICLMLSLLLSGCVTATGEPRGAWAVVVNSLDLDGERRDCERVHKVCSQELIDLRARRQEDKRIEREIARGEMLDPQALDVALRERLGTGAAGGSESNE